MRAFQVGCGLQNESSQCPIKWNITHLTCKLDSVTKVNIISGKVAEQILKFLTLLCEILTEANMEKEDLMLQYEKAMLCTFHHPRKLQDCHEEGPRYTLKKNNIAADPHLHVADTSLLT